MAHYTAKQCQESRSKKPSRDVQSLPVMTTNSLTVCPETDKQGSPIGQGSTHHEELAEGDVREDVVGLVLAAGDAGLLPEVMELILQGSARAQVQDVLSGQWVIQEGVIHMGEQPEEEQEKKKRRRRLIND